MGISVQFGTVYIGRYVEAIPVDLRENDQYGFILSLLPIRAFLGKTTTLVQ